MKLLNELIATSLTLIISVNSFGQGSLNQKLISTLDSMVAIDQKLQKELFLNEGGPKFDSLVKKEAEILETDFIIARRIFAKYGYPGFDLVGEKGSYNFWLLVQHCIGHTDFQKQVLLEMKKQVEKKNAHAFNYAHLYDRVQINTGNKQTYGTYISFDKHGNAFPENFDNWNNVDMMRKELGIETLKEYLDRASKANKERAKEKEQKN